MSIQKNINFESYIPTENYNHFKNSKKKIFKNLIKKTKESINEKKNVFHSFSKDFKLNFNIKELSKYKKFKKIVIIGFGGSILGAQSINFFFEKKFKKKSNFYKQSWPKSDK